MSSWASLNKLPPISTASAQANANRQTATSSGSHQPSNSPQRGSFGPSVGANHHNNHISAHANSRSNVSRTSSVSSASSLFSPSASGTGVQQQSSHPLLYSARVRNIPQSSSSQLPSVSAVGASSAGGSGPRLSRTSNRSPSLSQSSDVGSPQTSATSAPFPATGTASSIDIAQISIQLARIDKEKDPVKLDEAIRSLTAFLGRGMDVLMYTLRKLIKQHAARIFSSDASSENPSGSFTVLANEVESIRTKPDQALKIAEAIDTNEGEPFRDFDLSSFMEAFTLDPVAKCMLALALKGASKPDLKTKSDAILANNLESMFMSILNPTSESGDDLPASYLGTLIDRLLQSPPRNWNEEALSNLNFAIRARFDKLGRPAPNALLSIMQLAELTNQSNELVRLIQRIGERATSSLEACKEVLASAETRHINYTQVASVLLYMVITQNGETYNAATFVNALKEHRAGRRLDWQDVVASFNREGLVISKHQFLLLYEALLPLASEYENFDIQLLWGGQWSQVETQLSFVVAFLSCTADELDANAIPKLRRAYTVEDFQDASEEVREYAALAVRHPLVSLDATTALFNMIFQDQNTYKNAIGLGIPEAVINPHTPYFVVASAAVPQPWGGLKDQAFDQLFLPFLRKQLAGYSFVFHGLWRSDGTWLAGRLVRYHATDQLLIGYIYEHAVEHDWLSALTGIQQDFGLDLATYAHGHGEFDIEGWLAQSQENTPHLATALAQFIEEKARLDTITQKESGIPVTTVPLTVDTVYILLTWLSQVLPEDVLINLNRTAISAYPRLVNYGEGFDEIIKGNGKDGNAVSPEADAAMQEHFKRLYNRETDVKTMIESLQRFKNSMDPVEQEVFACMIQGLFDEYSCFGEYPPDALATTAVLFGSIINFNLLSSIALQAGLSMILEALQTATSREDRMYKFGLQALTNFQSKLPEWPTFCEKLLSIDDLQATEVYKIAENIVLNRRGSEANGDIGNGTANGFADELVMSESSQPFASLAIDPLLRPELYQDPEEEIQDRVIFEVNNLSDRNIDERYKSIKDAISEEHNQWFAVHIVEDRVKTQPNYHDLYLKLLRLLDDPWLWREVVRETIVSCVRMINADTTLTNTNDRNLLKNLGTWLGYLTLARDKPILHRNIAFVELLIEAQKTKRVIVVLPWVCRVLKAAAGSKTFQPSNPWTAEVLSVLGEFYFHVEMKIQMKFEIEVLCKELGIDHMKLEPSAVIRESEYPFHDDFAASVPEGLEGFHDLTLANLSRQNMRSGMSERFNATAVISALPDISGRLYYPQTSSSNQVTAEQTRSIFLNAAEQAIREIIFPVVERSVTIASISASQLVTKDFATEDDEEKYRNAAHSMVKSLAGSLALVTCREPLRMSMSNNVRAFSRSLPGDGLPEGIVIMFVNENIDAVCKIVEEAAEKQSIAVIDEAIQEGISVRSLFHQQAENQEPFQFPQVNRFARMMPEPFRPSDGHAGLTSQQLAIYENFGPTRAAAREGALRGDQSDEALLAAGVPSLSTPNMDPRSAPSRSALDGPESRANGYSGSLEDLLADVFDAAKVTPEESIAELPVSAPLKEVYQRLMRSLQGSTPSAQHDNLVTLAAQQVLQYLFSRPERKIETEVAAQLLFDLCNQSPLTAHRLWQIISTTDDEHLLINSQTTIALLARRLIHQQRVDVMLANALRTHSQAATTFFSDLLDAVLLGEYPVALRADFSHTIEALSQWLVEEPQNDSVHALCERLNGGRSLLPSNAADIALTPPASKTDQLEHIFDEWMHLQRNGATEKTSLGFVHQLHKQKVLRDTEAACTFFRACIETSIALYEVEEENMGQLQAAYIPIDAFAHLVITLVLYQGEVDGAVKISQSAYLDSLLALIATIQTHHFHERNEHANAKVFFRLYSVLLSSLHQQAHLLGNETYEELNLTFGNLFLALQPKWLVGFTFSWLGLVSHRVFTGALLRMSPAQRGSDTYVSLLEIALQHCGVLVHGSENSRDTAGYIMAVFRIFLVLHHDFNDFLIENAARLCAAIPNECPQLRNLICAATPASVTDLPDPFGPGLIIDRVEDARRNPVVRLDFTRFLTKAGLKDIVDRAVRDSRDGSSLRAIIDTLEHSEPVQASSIAQAVVLYLGTEAIKSTSTKSPFFNNNAPQFVVLNSIALNLSPLASTAFVNAIINQLRYPNSHTTYFSQALLEMFGPPTGDAKHEALKERIAAMLLERMMPIRPHPWGVMVTFLELVRGKDYEFQGLSWVRENDDIWGRARALDAGNGMAGSF